MKLIKLVRNKKVCPTKERKEEKPFLEKMKVLFYICKVFGMSPHSIYSGRLVRAPIWSYIFTTLILSVQLYEGSCKILLKFDTVQTSNQILTMTNMARMIYSLLSFIGEGMISLLQRNKFNLFFNKLEIYDNAIRNMGYRFRESFASYIWIYLPFITYIIIIFRMTIKLLPKNIDNGLWSFIWQTILVLVYKQFIFSSFTLGSVRYLVLLVSLIKRFRDFNERLLSSKIQQMPSHIYKRRTMNIHDIKFLHLTLVEAGETLNEIYSLLPYFWLSILSIHLLDVFKDTINDSIGISLPKILTFTFLYFYFFGLPHLLNNEVKKTGKLILKRTSLLDYGVNRMERINIAMYFNCTSLKYTAAGTFILNLPYLLSVFGTTLLRAMIIISKS